MNTNKVARACSKSFFQLIQASSLYFFKKRYDAWILLIFRKCQLYIVLDMFLIFCQTLGSCFWRIDYYMALFLKTFSLTVSLNFHTFYKLIFRLMYFIDWRYFFRIFSLSILVFRIPFIASLRYFRNINTKFSSSNLNSEK